MLPTPILDYLLQSPLPTLVLSFQPSSSAAQILTSTPLIANLALQQLTRGRGLMECLDQETFNDLLVWVEDRNGEEDLNLSLHLPAVVAGLSSGSGTGSANSSNSSLPSTSSGTSSLQSSTRTMVVRFRKSIHSEHELSYLVLTALSFPPKRLEGKTIRVPQKVIEKREERSEAERLVELEMLFDCSKVGLARLTLEGRVMWVNQSWWNISRLDPRDPDSKPDDWVKNIDAGEYDAFMVVWHQARMEMAPWEYQFRFKAGVIILAQCAPNNPDPEFVTGWIMNLTDVTERVKAAEEVKQMALERAAAAQALEAAEERRRDAEAQRSQQELVLDVTSHELRNPISAIYQNAELTRTSLERIKNLFMSMPSAMLGPGFEKDKILREVEDDIEAVASIGECAMAQERVANDILGMAHVASQGYSIQRVPFCLATSLRTTLRMFGGDCAKKDIQLELLFGRMASLLGDDIDILADSVRFSQILINLISNAIRFTAPRPIRRIAVSVDLSSRPPGPDEPAIPQANFDDLLLKAPDEMYLYFAVEDSGPGMTAEEAERVSRGLSKSTPLGHVKMGGSGLGLWIARNLCELHGGRFELATQLGIGSVFRGYIRVALVPTMSTPRTRQAPLPSPAHNASRELAPDRPLRILVVDDNQINRTIFVRQLTLAGHLVECATDGGEALEKLLGDEKDNFDCCLMDVEMPRVDGITATRTLREAEIGTGRHLRVVGCTGNARDGQIAGAISGGMDALITKPYRLAELLEALAG